MQKFANGWAFVLLVLVASLSSTAAVNAQGAFNLTNETALSWTTTGGIGGAVYEIQNTGQNPLRLWRVGFRPNAAGTHMMDVYYRVGGCFTSYPPTTAVTQFSGWTLCGSASVTFPTNAVTQIPVDMNVIILPNEVLGILVNTTTATAQYTSNTGAPNFSNADLTIRSQGGKTTNPTPAPGSPAGTPFTSGNIPRVMPTTIWYDYASSTWKGGQGNQWNTAGNWSGPVPSTQAETIIEAASTWAIPTNVPVLSNNAVVSRITVETGGSLNGGTNGNIRVHQGFIIEQGATFNPGQSTIRMEPAAPSPVPLEMRLSGSSVYNVNFLHNTVVEDALVVAPGGTIFIAPGVTVNFLAGADFSAGSLANQGTMDFSAIGTTPIAFPGNSPLGEVLFDAPAAGDNLIIAGNLQLQDPNFTGAGTVTFAGNITADTFRFAGQVNYVFQGTLTADNIVISGNGTYSVAGIVTANNLISATTGAIGTGSFGSNLVAPNINMAGDGALTIAGNYIAPTAQVLFGGNGGSLTINGNFTADTLTVAGSSSLAVNGNVSLANYGQSTVGVVTLGSAASTVTIGNMNMFSGGQLNIGGDLNLTGNVVDTATNGFNVGGDLLLNGTAPQNISVGVHRLMTRSIQVTNQAGVIMRGRYHATAATSLRVAANSNLRLDPNSDVLVGGSGISGGVLIEGNFVTLSAGGAPPKMSGGGPASEKGVLVLANGSSSNIDGLSLLNFGLTTQPYAIVVNQGASVATFNSVHIEGCDAGTAAVQLNSTTFPRNLLNFAVTGDTPGNIDATNLPEFVPGQPTTKLVISIGKGSVLTTPDKYGVPFEIDPNNVLSWEGAPQLTITTLSLPAATSTVAYTATLASIGGNQPVVWGLAVAPEWLSINPVTGELSGLPGPGDVGSSTVTITASDTSLPPGIQTKSFTLLVQSLVTIPLTITTTTMASALEGKPYGYTLSAAGGAGTYVWSIGNAAVLPSGMTFNGARGELSGTPAAGTAQRVYILFVVTDQGGNGQAAERLIPFDVFGPLNDPDARQRLLNNPTDSGSCSLTAGSGRTTGTWLLVGALAILACAAATRRRRA